MSPLSRAPAQQTYRIPVAGRATLEAQEHLPREPVDPDLPTVVLSHGWTLNRREWLPVVDELHAHRPVRVVSYDLRGHGASSMGTERASVRLLGDDLATVIGATVPNGPIVLGGHSMGGMATMAYAGRHHGDFAARVRGVTLVATAASLQGRRPIPFEGLVMGVAARAPRIAPGFLVPTSVQGPMMFGPGARPQDVKTAVAMIKRTKMPTIGAFFNALGEHDEIEALAHFIDVPTHVLVGTKDRLTPVEMARALTAAIPTARLTVLPGLGHMLPYEATATVADSLLEFLPAR